MAISKNTEDTGIVSLSDAQIGNLKPIRVEGDPEVQSNAGVEGAFRMDAQDALIRSIEEEERAKGERFAGSPTWTHRDQLDYSRLESVGRLFLEHPDEHDDNEFGAILDQLNTRRFGIPTQLMAAFDRVGDEHGNQARLREFFAMTDRLNAVKTADEQQNVLEEQFAKALPDYAAWTEAKNGADGGAAYAREVLKAKGRDWADTAGSVLDAINPNAWLDYATDKSGNVPRPSSDITDAQAIAEVDKKFTSDRVLMNAAKLTPFLKKNQREFVNLAAHGAPLQVLEGLLGVMDEKDRDLMRSLAQAVRPAHEDLPWIPDEALIRVGRSASGALRGFGRFGKMAGVYLGGLGYVDWNTFRIHHLAPGTVERMNAMRKEFEEDIKNYEALDRTKLGDASDFASRAVNGFFDSAPMQLSTISGALLRRGGAALSKSGQKWGAVAEGAGWALQGYVAVSMIGEHFDNLVMNGVSMEHAVPLSLYGGIADALVENWNVDQWLGAKLSAEEARYVGWRAAFRVARRHNLNDLRMMAQANLKQAVMVTFSELCEEMVQGWDKQGVLSLAEGRNLVDAYTNSEAGQALVDSLVEALPTCAAFGLVSSADLSGHARKGGIATYQENLEDIARAVAKKNGADTLDIEVRRRYEAEVKNTADEIYRATAGMKRGERAKYLAGEQLNLTPAEQAFYAAHCDFFDTLAAQDGALYASAVAGGSINEALFAKAGWRFEHGQNGEITRIVSPDGKIDEAVHVFNRQATIDDLDDAMLHDFINEWNTLIEEGTLKNEKPFAAVSATSAKSDVSAWDEAERKRLESAITEQTPGFFNENGITLFLGTKDAVAGSYRAEGTLTHEVLHAFTKKLEEAGTRRARKDLRGLVISLGKGYNEALSREGEAAGLADALKAITEAEPDKIDWKAVGHNAAELARRVFTLGLSRGDFEKAFVEGDFQGVDPAKYMQVAVGQGLLAVKELQELQKAQKAEHKKLVERILAERKAKRERKIGLRAAQRAAEERADREAAEAEARRIEGQQRAEAARKAAEERERQRIETQFFLNRLSNRMPELQPNAHATENGLPAVFAYRVLWKVARQQPLTDAEKNTLGDTYGVPVEALTNPETFSDETMARLQDGIARLWNDAANANIVVPPVYVETEADTHRILPNEVYDPVFQVFRNGEVLVDPSRAVPFTPQFAPGAAAEADEAEPVETPAPTAPSVSEGSQAASTASTATPSSVPAAHRAPVGDRVVAPAPREDVFEFNRGGTVVRLVGGLWNWLHKPFNANNESPTASRQDADGHGLWNGRRLPESVAQALAAWKDHCPKYMGNKNEMLKRVVQALCNNMTQAERNGYTHLNDCFGGGGCWGLSIAMTALPNVKTIIVNEFDEGRIEKIRVLHTLDGQMEAKLRDFIVGRGLPAAIEARMRAQVSERTGSTLAPNGFNTRRWCFEVMQNEIANLSSEEKGLLWSFLDNLQAQMQWSLRDAQGNNSLSAIIEHTIRNVGKDAVKATELAEAFKARGGTITYSAGDAKKQADFGVRLDTDGVYRRGAAGEALAVPHGGNVMSVTDPPYYLTECYSYAGGRTKVGLEADPMGWGYGDTQKMLGTLVDLHDGIVYTDEAWWFKQNYRFDETRTPREEQILGAIMSDFDHFDVAGGVAGRQETLGVQHGRRTESAENGANAGNDDNVAGLPDGRGVRDVLQQPVSDVAAAAQGEDGSTPRSDDRGRGPLFWDGNADTLAQAVAEGWEIPRRLRGYANRLLDEAADEQRRAEAHVESVLQRATHFSIRSRDYSDRNVYPNADLENRAHEGDMEAAYEWWQRNLPALIRKGMSKGLTHEHAEAVVDKMLEEVILRYGNGDRKPNVFFPKWVYGAIGILAKDQHNRLAGGGRLKSYVGSREDLTLNATAYIKGDEAGEVIDHIVDPNSVDPAYAALGDYQEPQSPDRKDEFYSYLAHFNPEKQAVFKARLIEGKSAADVAEQFKASVEAVNTTVEEMTEAIRTYAPSNSWPFDATTDKPMRRAPASIQRVYDYFVANPYATSEQAAVDLGYALVEGHHPGQSVMTAMYHATHKWGLPNPRKAKNIVQQRQEAAAMREAADGDIPPLPPWEPTPRMKTIDELAKQGLYADEIAERIGISRASVHSDVNRAATHGFNIPLAHRKPIRAIVTEFNEREKKLIAMAEQGYTRKQAAKALGTTISSYLNTARKKGWTGRFVDEAQTRFSISPFKPNEHLTEVVSAAIEHKQGDEGYLPQRRVVELSNVPDVLLFCGVPNANIITLAGRIRHVHEKHGLSAEQLAEIPNRYARPLFVFRDNADSFAIVTDMLAKTESGEMKPVMVHLEPAAEGKMNFIASVYPREPGKEQAYVNWAKAGGLLYADTTRVTANMLEDATWSQLRPLAYGDSVKTPKMLDEWSSIRKVADSMPQSDAEVNPAKTQFSIATRDAGTALKYYLAREIMERGGRLPDTRHAKFVARSFGVPGDISGIINAAMAEAAKQTRVLRYIASDPQVERAVAAAGKSLRYEAAIKRAREVQLKWSQDVSEAKANTERARDRAVRAVRGEDYETMVTREGIDLNTVLLAIRPDEKPPKAHERTSDEGGAAEGSSVDAAAEAQGKALAQQVIERAAQLAEEAKAADRTRAERGGRSGNAQEAAQEPAGRADEGEADDSASPFESAVAKAYRRAIRESGITLDNPAQVVQLVKAITEKYIRDNPATVSDLDPNDVWASPVARAMLAGNLASFAQSVAAAYSPSHARIRVAKKAQMLNDRGVNTLTRIEQVGEAVFRDLNKDIIRQTRSSLIADIRKIAANPGKHFSERVETKDRKVSADTSRYCKWVTWAMNVPATKVEDTMLELEDFLNGYGGNTPENNRFQDFAEAQIKLRVLDQYGNLRARMPAELAEIRDRLAQMVDEGTFETMAFSEQWESARNAGVEAAVPAIAANPSDKGVQPEPNFFRDLSYSLVGMWETKWRQLTRFCRDDAARTQSLEAMSRVEEMIQGSEDTQFNYMQEQKRKLRDLLGSTYGSEKDARKALSVTIDESLWPTLDRGDQHTQWTVGRLLQMYVSCVQPEYADNCEKYGRDAAYVAHLEDVIRGLDPRHFALIDGLRQLYLEQGDALSEVMERTAGTRLYTPNRLYMPVTPLRTHDLGKKGEGRGYSPFAASLTPRVKHGLDFDQTTDILELFVDRAEDAAHTIGWAENGSMVLGICQSDRVLNAIRTAFGSKVMGQWNSYVLDIVAGTKDTPSGDEAAPMRVLARYASRLWIGLNPVSWTKQILSFPCFALSLDGSLKDVVCSGAFWTLHPIEAFRCARDLADTRAFQARYGIAISQELRYATSSEGTFKTWWQKTMDKVMSGVYAFDMATVYLQAGIYRRRRAELEKNGMDAHEASETAAAWLMHIVDKTAQTARTLNTTQLQRAGGAWAFMLQFKSAPAQQSQFEITAAQEVLANPADAKRWKKLATVIAVNHIIVPAMNTIIESAFAALVQGGMPDDEKRKRQLATLLANMLTGSLGSIVFIGFVVEGLASALMDKVVLDRKPSMYNFSRQQIPALSVIGNAFGAYNQFAEALENMQWADVSDTAIEMATAIGSVIPGLSWPARTVEKAHKARKEP